ncbi:MAG TPA: hypothetical protein VIH61_09450 [Waddliaceae bacterium]
MKTIQITDNHKIKTSVLMDNLRKKFTVYSYWNNKELDNNFPQLEETTTREFIVEQESSTMKGSSWNDMADIRDDMMTFREYILFFEAYHKETGEYPDDKGWTLFKDSLPDGYVAYGRWYPGDRGVRFSWNGPGYRDSNCGARVCLQSNGAHNRIITNEKDNRKQEVCVICKQCGFQNPIGIQVVNM